MKKTIIFSVLAAVIVSLCACAPEKSGAREITIFEMESVKDSVMDLLARPCDWPKGYENDECFRITPQDITDKYGFAIYKFDQSCTSYLEYKDVVYLIGEGLGGYGMVSFAVADMNDDRHPELYYTYSWGSGIHRSMLGYFDSATKKNAEFDYAYMDGDMVLTAQDGRLFVCAAQLDVKSFVDISAEAKERLGEISCGRDGMEFVPVDADEQDAS